MRHVALLLLVAVIGCSSDEKRVVLYCAQDRLFAEQVLADFTSQTNVRVDPKFDTEANKSVGLYVELVQDRKRPRCDVFWNNEILSTIRLQKQGLLQPYDSPSAKPYPDVAKAKDHTWHAFAARARILIVNTKHVSADEIPKSLFDLTLPKWKGRIVMARPVHGTSATQAGCLFAVLGAEKAKKYYRDLRANQVQLAPGNKDVAEWVARGQSPDGRSAWIGVTDTDDAALVMETYKDVTIVFPDQEGIGTLIIPNTVSMLKNCPHPEEAKQLIDYLLSPEMERKLAEGRSHQLPLNPEVIVELPKSLSPLKDVKRMKVDYEKAAEAWDEVQRFLQNETLKD